MRRNNKFVPTLPILSSTPKPHTTPKESNDPRVKNGCCDSILLRSTVAVHAWHAQCDEDDDDDDDSEVFSESVHRQIAEYCQHARLVSHTNRLWRDVLQDDARWHASHVSMTTSANSSPSSSSQTMTRCSLEFITLSFGSVIRRVGLFFFLWHHKPNFDLSSLLHLFSTHAPSSSRFSTASCRQLLHPSEMRARFFRGSFTAFYGDSSTLWNVHLYKPRQTIDQKNNSD